MWLIATELHIIEQLNFIEFSFSVKVITKPPLSNYYIPGIGQNIISFNHHKSMRSVLLWLRRSIDIKVFILKSPD